MSNSDPVGTCCIVLHSHLPWLAHHGSWPVGEEWLFQSWAAAYLPVFDLLERLAGQGRRDLLTLGVTPVLAAQLDDPYCLREFHTWLGFWQLRAEGLASSTDPELRTLGAREFGASQLTMASFEQRWRHGASPVLRRLVDAGTVELLGGPATHPFLPLLDERLTTFALRSGLDDSQLRLGSRPAGIWAPECGYTPGLENVYEKAGVQRFVLDGPTLRGAGVSTGAAWRVAGSDVVAFGRDLDVSYRIWSPRRGYPGGTWYRDFHTYHHDSGFRPARVTTTRTPPEQKAPYEPVKAALAVSADADDFVATVRARLVRIAAERGGRPGLVTVAYDTELFGHWWHEGPAFLEAVLSRMPAAGIELRTLRGAVEAGHVEGNAAFAAGTWGSGKDSRVWDGEQVRDLVATNGQVAKRLLDVVDSQLAPGGAPATRRPDLDQLAKDALLTLSSDWAFMVTKDSAAEYALSRARGHQVAFSHLARAIDAGHGRELAHLQGALDGPFAQLDARQLRRR